jgi:hypothetical protein
MRDKLQLPFFVELCTDFGIKQLLTRTRLDLIFYHVTGAAKQCTLDQLAVVLAAVACELLSQSEYCGLYPDTKSRVCALFRRMYLEDCNRSKLLSSIKDFEILHNRSTRRRASILSVVPFVMAFRGGVNKSDKKGESGDEDEDASSSPCSLRGPTKSKQELKSASTAADNAFGINAGATHSHHPSRPGVRSPPLRPFRERALSRTLSYNVDKCLNIVDQHKSKLPKTKTGNKAKASVSSDAFGSSDAVSATDMLAELGLPNVDDSDFSTAAGTTVNSPPRKTKASQSKAAMNATAPASVADAWSREFDSVEWDVSPAGQLVTTTKQPADAPSTSEHGVATDVSTNHGSSRAKTNKTSDARPAQSISGSSSTGTSSSGNGRQRPKPLKRKTYTKPVLEKTKVYNKSRGRSNPPPRVRTSDDEVTNSSSSNKRGKSVRVVLGSPPPPARLQRNMLGSAFVSSNTRAKTIPGRFTRRTRIAEKGDKANRRAFVSGGPSGSPRKLRPSKPTGKPTTTRQSQRPSPRPVVATKLETSGQDRFPRGKPPLQQQHQQQHKPLQRIASKRSNKSVSRSGVKSGRGRGGAGGGSGAQVEINDEFRAAGYEPEFINKVSEWEWQNSFTQAAQLFVAFQSRTSGIITHSYSSYQPQCKLIGSSVCQCLTLCLFV